MGKNWQVLPRLELGLLDSESKVLTITPWDHMIRFHFSIKFPHTSLQYHTIFLIILESRYHTKILLSVNKFEVS